MAPVDARLLKQRKLRVAIAMLRFDRPPPLSERPAGLYLKTNRFTVATAGTKRKALRYVPVLNVCVRAAPTALESLLTQWKGLNLSTPPAKDLLPLSLRIVSESKVWVCIEAVSTAPTL